MCPTSPRLTQRLSKIWAPWYPAQLREHGVCSSNPFLPPGVSPYLSGWSGTRQSEAATSYSCHYVSRRTWARPRDKAARGLPGPAALGGTRGKPFLGRDISAGLYWGWGSWSLYRENSHLGQLLFPRTLGTSPEGPFPSCAGLVPAFGADHGKSMGGSVTLRKAALETAGPEFAS